MILQRRQFFSGVAIQLNIKQQIQSLPAFPECLLQSNRGSDLLFLHCF